MRRIGMFVILAGLVTVGLSAITISRPREVARVGSVRINIQEERRQLLPAWVGGVVAAVGVVLVVAGARRRRPDGSEG